MFSMTKPLKLCASCCTVYNLDLNTQYLSLLGGFTKFIGLKLGRYCTAVRLSVVSKYYAVIAESAQKPNCTVQELG